MVCQNFMWMASELSLARPLHMGPVIVLGKPNADPHKAVPIPRCLRAASGTLCQRVRAGLLVADGVYPGHFLGKVHMAPSERRVGTLSPADASRCRGVNGRQAVMSHNGSTAATPCPLGRCLGL